jgi:hypothetical protein
VRALIVALLAACNPYNDDLGDTPFLCGATEPRCPDGYSCGLEAETGRAICVRGEAPEVACNDDSAREPNEDTAMPTVTPIDSEPTFELAASAVCPDGDADTYSLTLSATASIELIVTYEDGGAALDAKILNTGGVPIATAAPIEDGSTTVRAVAVDLDAGMYFVRVAGPDAATIRTNNYALTINVE